MHERDLLVRGVGGEVFKGESGEGHGVVYGLAPGVVCRVLETEVGGEDGGFVPAA